MTKKTKAPQGLSPAARRHWARVTATYDFAEAELVLLESALRALDRAEKAREKVQKEGMTVVTPGSGVTRPHPAASIEDAARREFRIAWKTLGLVSRDGGLAGGV